MALMKRPRNELDWPDRFFGRRLFEWPETWRDLLETDEATIRVEEYRDDAALVVKAELPGIDPDEDVEITVSDHVLQIKAERKQETRTEDAKGFRSEFHYGSFLRAITLPVGATEDDVTATYADGILEVRVPINEEQAAAKKIPVSHG